MISEATCAALARGDRVEVDYTDALSVGWVSGFGYPASEIGPRVVGGVYRSGYWHETYRVLALKVGLELTSRIEAGRLICEPRIVGWWMEVQWDGNGNTTKFSTAWDYDPGNRVVSLPALPKRVRSVTARVTRVPGHLPRWHHIILPNGTHLCSLCRPGIIGTLEREWRRGTATEGELMRAVQVIQQHNAYIAGVPGVSLAKAGVAV